MAPTTDSLAAQLRAEAELIRKYLDSYQPDADTLDAAADRLDTLEREKAEAGLLLRGLEDVAAGRVRSLAEIRAVLEETEANRDAAGEQCAEHMRGENDALNELAACQRELAEAHAFLTGKGETGYCMTHPSGEPDTELGKAARALKLRAEAAEAEIEAAWFGIEHSFEMEPRELIAKESKTNGFKYPLAQAVHTIWKREPKVADVLLRAEAAELKLEEANRQAAHAVDRWERTRNGQLARAAIARAEQEQARAEAAEAERDTLLRDRGWQTTQCLATAGHPAVRCGLEEGHDGMHFCGDPRTGYGYRWPISHAKTQ